MFRTYFQQWHVSYYVSKTGGKMWLTFMVMPHWFFFGTVGQPKLLLCHSYGYVLTRTVPVIVHKLLCVCVWCMQIHMGVHVFGGQRSILGVFLSCPLVYLFIETGFLIKPCSQIQLGWLASELQRFALFTLQMLGLQTCATTVGFYRCWGSTLGLALAQQALSHEAILQPL